MRLFAFLTMIFPAFAFANLTGRWDGAGEWLYQGRGTECAMTISFQESPTELTRTGGFINCGIVTMTSGRTTWTKRGADLLLGSQVVGRRTADTLEFVDVPDDYPMVRARTRIRILGNSLQSEERWIGSDGREIYLIRGEFGRR